MSVIYDTNGVPKESRRELFIGFLQFLGLCAGLALMAWWAGK